MIISKKSTQLFESCQFEKDYKMWVKDTPKQKEWKAPEDTLSLCHNFLQWVYTIKDIWCNIIFITVIIWMNRYNFQFSSAQFSRSVVSHSLQPHGLQYARPPCPSPTPGVYSYSCPLGQWCQYHFILCHPLLLLPSVLPSNRVFPKKPVLCIRWPKYLELQHQSF